MNYRNNESSRQLINDSIFFVYKSPKNLLKRKIKRSISINSIISNSLSIKIGENIGQNKETNSKNNILHIKHSQNVLSNKNDEKNKTTNIKNLKTIENENLINDIQQELNNIANNSTQEQSNECYKVQYLVPKIFHSEIKINLQEYFDNLCALMTEITKLILKLNNLNYNCFDNIKFYYVQLSQKTGEILNLVEKITENLKEYKENIISLGLVFEKFEKEFEEKKFNELLKDLNALKKIYQHEYNIYKENIMIYEKINKAIPYLCNQILINTENKKKLSNIEKKINELLNNN